MPITRYRTSPLIESRHFKILSMKKNQLANSIVFVCLDEDKYKKNDKFSILQMLKKIDEIEPTAMYFPLFGNIDISIYNRFDFKGKDLLVKVSASESAVGDKKSFEKNIRASIPEAKDIKFVYKVENIL